MAGLGFLQRLSLLVRGLLGLLALFVLGGGFLGRFRLGFRFVEDGAGRVPKGLFLLKQQIEVGQGKKIKFFVYVNTNLPYFAVPV